MSVDYREHVIIFDAGSGLRQLGLVLMARDTPPSTGSLFLTHTHWDHIQGLPFFTLAFAPENYFVFYGEARPRYSKPLRMKLTGRWGAMPLASQVERWRSHFGSGCGRDRSSVVRVGSGDVARCLGSVDSVRGRSHPWRRRALQSCGAKGGKFYAMGSLSGEGTLEQGRSACGTAFALM